jgi:hypothetical protein
VRESGLREETSSECVEFTDDMEAMLKGEREASPCQECSVALVVKLAVFRRSGS